MANDNSLEYTETLSVNNQQFRLNKISGFED